MFLAKLHFYLPLWLYSATKKNWFGESKVLRLYDTLVM
jgi:hypothetical protein